MQYDLESGEEITIGGLKLSIVITGRQRLTLRADLPEQLEVSRKPRCQPLRRALETLTRTEAED